MKNRANLICVNFCVNCGGNATKGNMKYPICGDCFKINFKDSWERYNKIVEKVPDGYFLHHGKDTKIRAKDDLETLLDNRAEHMEG